MILKLDLDTPTVPPLGRWMLLLARAGYRFRWLAQQQSPSGRGWHVEAAVTPRPTSAQEVVLLQLLLGSDPGREAYNITRARQVDRRQVPRWWRSRWNVLYG